MNYSVFDTLLDGVVVLDPSAQMVYGNQTASQFFDVSQRRLQSRKPFSEVVTFAEMEWLAPDQLAQITVPTSYKELLFECKSGKTGRVQVTAQVHEHTGERHYVLFIRDVTLEETLQRKYRAELEQKEHVIEDLKKAQAELENYSKNLEKMVEVRTAELSEANRLLSAILNSLGQGFLVFNAEGQCLPIYSRICSEILEGIPAGRSIDEVLRVNADDLQAFQMWRTTLFAEPIPFADLTPLGPSLFPHSNQWRVELEYYPMRDEKGAVSGVVVVASDKTAEFQARQQAEVDRERVQMILKVVRSKRQFLSFLSEAEKLLAELREAASPEAFNEKMLAYHLHTLKGGAGSFSLKSVHDLAHQAEDLLLQIKRGNDEQRLAVAIKVASLVEQMHEALEQFVHQYGVLLGGALNRRGRNVEIAVSDILPVAHKLSGELGECIRNWALEPLSQQFAHYSDLAQDLAIGQNKKLAPLIFTDGDLRLMPEPYESLFANCVHIFRNAVDHGLEMPADRIANGKSEAGHIRVQGILSADRRRLQLTISDDGSGIDPQRIRNKLQSLGVNAEHENDNDVIQHVFDDAFSTRDLVSDVSGRGAGLAALKHAVEQLGGTIRVHSVVGQGSTFVMDLPYVTDTVIETSRAA